MCTFYILFACTILLSLGVYVVSIPVLLEDVAYWKTSAQKTLKEAKARSTDTRTAKNIILFIGDGMGPPTLTAARIYKGQLEGKNGEETNLEWDNFPNLAAIKTYAVDHQIPDSAATATALMCGIKTNFQTIAVDSTGKHNECNTEQNAKVDCLMDWAQKAGKSTGVVTTARITHATPGPTYAHTVNRDWEVDSAIPLEDRTKCPDIASQLIDNPTGSKLQVIFGGGAQFFYPNTTKTQFHKNGLRNDDRYLIDEWTKKKINENQKYQVVFTQKQLEALDTSSIDYVLGLFNDSHMAFDIDRNKLPDGEPSIAQMTTKAIQILSKNPKGFILMVEGALIDIAHHLNMGKHALAETVAFNSAVKAALSLVNLDETLIIVTADHSHTMLMQGYTLRGNPILGIANISAVDSLPFTTLMYGSGPSFSGYYPEGHRPNITGIDTNDSSYLQFSAVPESYGYHGGEDVHLYAIGPKADLFYGVKEQHYVAHVMAYAAGLGEI